MSDPLIHFTLYLIYIAFSCALLIHLVVVPFMDYSENRDLSRIRSFISSLIDINSFIPISMWIV
ncbi:hypothetical protein, partial [Bacillus cereus]|uniref:hypothetical protein n=1 Tax=Bacillus cereus TaxID=1396 RepID=UPI001C554946